MNNGAIWNHIIFTNNINLDDTFPIITSKQIKDSKNTWVAEENQFEPRILCKMDFSDSRPKILKDNNIFLISINKNTWLFTKTNIYMKLNKYISCPKLIQNKIQSCLLDFENSSSENSLLDILYYNHIFSEIIGEEMTIKLNSYRKTSNFNTFLNDTEITVKSQYEIDGCYESKNFICIVEAKMNMECKDFNLRQLYIPYMDISEHLKKKKISKKIVPLFIYQDKKKRIYIHQFEWMNTKYINNIREIASYDFVI